MKWAGAVAGTAALGVATVGYAVLIERQRFVLREAVLPVLAEGGRPIRILHVSDLHLTPNQRAKQRWVAALDRLEPDLVVDTGDNVAHEQAVPAVLRALEPLLARPGVFVFGSNDYFGPNPKNPLQYFRAGGGKRVHGKRLPWRDLRAAMVERGWLDATHRRVELDAGGQRVAVAGVDDPHIERDRYDAIAGPAPAGPAVRLGLTHSPEPRVVDRFAADGYDLVLAGHTHGGQLRVPWYGALVTNSGLGRSQARGVSQWDEHTWLHVSAGLGTSPYAPFRFACPPEASLLTLVPRAVGSGQEPVARPARLAVRH